VNSTGPALHMVKVMQVAFTLFLLAFIIRLSEPPHNHVWERALLAGCVLWPILTSCCLIVLQRLSWAPARCIAVAVGSICGAALIFWAVVPPAVGAIVYLSPHLLVVFGLKVRDAR
jgi:hypothetical protein